MENIFAPEKLDGLFRNVAQVEYEPELMVSTDVDLTSQVVCRASKTTHAAYLANREQITVSLQPLYNKIQLIDLDASQALVRFMAQQASELIDYCHGTRQLAIPNNGSLRHFMCQVEPSGGIYRPLSRIVPRRQPVTAPPHFQV